MKKLLILPLLVLLTGCVTYYQPETALEDGVYYAEDDPSYVVYEYYPGYDYYPWASIDYFYIGYYPYPMHGYYYGYGYSPWHYPHGLYGYFPPLYASHYYYRYPPWYPYSGYCTAYSRCDRGHRDDDGNKDSRVVRNGKRNQKKPAGAGIGEENVTPDEFENPNATFMTGGVPYRSYVSTRPAGYAGNQGMVIRSGESAKVGKSRIQPSTSTPGSNGIIIVAEPSGPSTTPASSGTAPATRSSSPPTSRSFSTRSSSRSVGRSSRSRSGASSSRTRTVRSTSPRPRRKQD